MKKMIVIPFLFFVLWAVGPAPAFSTGASALETRLRGLDARQALALANQWHWEHQPVQSHVTSKEIVFKFEGGDIRTIPLPEDEMVVAIAPYVAQTHT